MWNEASSHRNWERQTQIILPSGVVQTGSSGYTEIGVGMHYLKDGGWTESKELIEIVGDGAVARQGQIQAIFANNIATPGAIDAQHVTLLRSFQVGSGTSEDVLIQCELRSEHVNGAEQVVSASEDVLIQCELRSADQPLTFQMERVRLVRLQ